MIEKTLGGDRLGSGNKMKVAMHNYERSTHDLGNVWRSTVAPGTLVPFYKKLALNGDTWSIDLSTLVRTAPANGPLFGSYKLQADVFTVPIRLYNGILHNNMTKIGMDMSRVKLPKINVATNVKNRSLFGVSNFTTSQISSSSLMAYMGVRGIGDAIFEGEKEDEPSTTVARNINAIPFLAYYDIYKNYYTNKQENKGYIITAQTTTEKKYTEYTEAITQSQIGYVQREWKMKTFKGNTIAVNLQNSQNISYTGNLYGSNGYMAGISPISGTGNFIAFPMASNDRVILKYKGEINLSNTNVIMARQQTNGTWTFVLDNLSGEFPIFAHEFVDDRMILTPNFGDSNTWYFCGIYFRNADTFNNEIKLQSFPLDSIDQMRIGILRNTSLDETLQIDKMDEGQNYPYKAIWSQAENGDYKSLNFFKQNGLALKTYQSDIYNNWLSKEFIDGATGINAISAVNTESGSFTMDALNLAHKVYNMLNRIAVSGGTYEDWQEAVYGEDAIRRAESPIYEGGMSAEIVFEEVVSSADTQTPQAGDQPLGSLAGKGTVTNVKGGKIEIKVKEPSYIIGIMSITPRIDYCTGNHFDMTEIDSIDDLHKPAMDGIGFQNLLAERMAWWGKVYDVEEDRWSNQTVGKQPAWLDYMTSVNEVYGEFAEENGLNYMVLTRNYEYDGSQAFLVNNIRDITTYINPSKFNYTFANSDLDAMNFWVQIGIKATARRKMSAKIMPNL